MKDKEFMLNFADGIASFVNEVQLSENIKFEKRDKLLFCDNAILGHTGVSKYYEHELGGLSNKIVKIHKFDTDLLDVDSISTIIGKSITVMHPRDQYGKINFVDGLNYKDLEVGTVLKAWKDGEMIRGNLVIKDPKTIKSILDGDLKALSLGYNSKVEKIGDSDEYKQTKFYFNHLALVPKGRMINAQIVDEDTVGKEKIKMSLWQKIKDGFSNNSVKINEKDDVLEFGDEKHITKRYKVVEETNIYDDETHESEYETKTHEIEKHTHENDDGSQKPKDGAIGDEKTVEEKTEEVIKKVEDKTVEDEESKTGDEDTIEEENVEETQEVESTEEKEEIKKEEENKEGNFGDEDMTKEALQALKDEIKADLMKQIKDDDAFGDINPIKQQQEKEKPEFGLDFARDEALRKEAWDLATNPVRHSGDWSKLNQTRKELFNK